MKKLRTAVAGFGFMGKTHAANILNSNNMTLVAIVDSRINTLSAAKQEGNIQTGDIDPAALEKVRKYISLDDCLTTEKIDLVYVCVHTTLHFDMAMTALQHGAHVLLEKPFVIDIKQGLTLIDEAEKRGLKIGVAHVVRFMAAYVKLKEAFDNKTYGALKFLSLSRFSGSPAWGDWTKMPFGSTGGALFDLLVHDIDFANYLLGKPDEISCRTLPGRLSPYDYIGAFWKYYNNDLTVRIEGGNTFPSSFPFEASYKAVFDNATLFWTSNNGQEIKLITDDAITPVSLADATDAYRAEGQYFADAIINNTDYPALSPDSSLTSICICHQHTH